MLGERLRAEHTSVMILDATYILEKSGRVISKRKKKQGVCMDHSGTR